VIAESHKLGEVLRAAREAKGVGLDRVERDTKIRVRYLSALERGEYRELPGAVYTKGFLRNYGAYLGLDPEYLIDLFRIESAGAAVERPTVPTPPRPIAARRSRAFVITPGAVMAALTTVAVIGFVGYLVYQFVNFARTPELRVLDPAGDLAAYEGTTYVVRGVTEPNARVTISNLPENPTVTANAAGEFEVEVGLLPGGNQFTVLAFDPVTQRDSEPVTRRITVVAAAARASPSAGAVAFSLEQPVADASVNGPIPLAGVTQPGVTVAVSARLAAAPPVNFSVTDGAGDEIAVTPQPPAAPQPTTLTAGDDGRFAAELQLAAGTWDVVVVPAIEGIEPITRRVAVARPAGLVGMLRIVDGQSYLEVEEDGTPVSGVSGGISDPGETISLTADAQLRIRAGNAAAVRVTLNGFDLGAMGGSGAVIEWRIALADG
jgi:cytoskeletal protein RodZ